MSTVLLFRRKYFRSAVNIQHCFSLQRKCRLWSVKDRPWANGLNRLLSARRGLKKGTLAEMADVRPALISAVANSSKPPQIPTLQRIANGFTKYDRKSASDAPDVELWEFFVSDEQAAVLRERASKTRDDSAHTALLKRITESVVSAMKQVEDERTAPPAPMIVKPLKKHAR